MMTLLKILCAVDFSESSRFATDAAADLARRFGAELTLVHVREPPLSPEEQLHAARDLAESDRREMQAKLEAWRMETERLAGTPVKAILVHGASAPEIVATARNEHFDLLVTGTHSRKGIRRMLLGSVAERIVREAPCAVFVARAPDLGD